MSLLDEVRGLRRELKKLTEEADRIVRDHRYSEMTTREAVSACLADGEWWSTRKLITALREGGLDRTPAAVSDALNKLRKLESRCVPTGWQGGAKEWRLMTRR